MRPLYLKKGSLHGEFQGLRGGHRPGHRDTSQKFESDTIYIVSFFAIINQYAFDTTPQQDLGQ